MCVWNSTASLFQWAKLDLHKSTYIIYALLGWMLSLTKAMQHHLRQQVQEKSCLRSIIWVCKYKRRVVSVASSTERCCTPRPCPTPPWRSTIWICKYKRRVWVASCLCACATGRYCTPPIILDLYISAWLAEGSVLHVIRRIAQVIQVRIHRSMYGTLWNPS